MSKTKKKEVRCIIHEFGLQLLVHPDGVDTWTSAVSYIRGSNDFFDLIDYRISGKIRLSVVNNHFLIDRFRQIHQFEAILYDSIQKQTVVEAILVDFMCRNRFIPKLSGKPKEIVLDIEGDNVPNELEKQIKSCFREDFTWSHLSRITNQCVISFSFAVVLVDDVSKFHQRLKESKPKRSFTMYESGVLVLETGSEIEDLEIPHFRLGVPAFHLFLLEEKNLPSIRKHIDYLLYFNHLRILQTQIHMVKARCTNLLESLPERKPQSYSARKERIQKLTKISEDLFIYRSTHLLAKDFILYEKPREPIQDSTELDLDKEIIEEKLDIVGENLQLIEETLRTRITLENMIVERYREEQQERTASAFNTLSTMIGILFIFEVIAAFLSFYFTPDSHYIWVLWFVTLFSPLLLIIWALRRMGKSLSEGNNEKETYDDGEIV